MWLFLKFMNLFVYSDESGVFDYLHNRYFLFAGLILFGQEEKDKWSRQYANVETVLRKTGPYDDETELKATNITNEEKSKLYRSLNGVYKFCVLIKQKDLLQKVFENKRHKQRYLDYAYKMVLKKCFETLIREKYISPKDIDVIYVYVDEHTTATDGKYELREGLLTEFKYGTFNPQWDRYFQPIFPRMKDVVVNFCDSKKKRLVRAADIVANHCFYIANQKDGDLSSLKNTFVYELPANRCVAKGLEHFEALKEARVINEGMTDLKEGRVQDGETVREEMKKKYGL